MLSCPRRSAVSRPCLTVGLLTQKQAAILMNQSGFVKLRLVCVLCYHRPRSSFKNPFSMQAVSKGLMLRERMRTATSVLVLTGAGVSAESGVPTFRGGGNTAVWKGLPFEVMSSAGMLRRDLPAVWEWFNYRRSLLTTLQPNAAHRTIASWQEHFSDLSLVTQNIDGLHQADRKSTRLNSSHGYISYAVF